MTQMNPGEESSLPPPDSECLADWINRLFRGSAALTASHTFVKDTHTSSEGAGLSWDRQNHKQSRGESGFPVPQHEMSRRAAGQAFLACVSHANVRGHSQAEHLLRPAWPEALTSPILKFEPHIAACCSGHLILDVVKITG